MRLLNDIRSNLDKKENTCLVFLDFSKAFDTLSHRMLLDKLHYFGFSTLAIKFFQDYLRDRSACVSLSKQFCIEKSEYLSVRTGVPQGSILGPLLFSIYVSDLNSCVRHSRLQQFADDSQLHINFATDNMLRSQTGLNSDLNRIVSYSRDHNLVLNASKSGYMLLCNNTLVRDYISSSVEVCIRSDPLPLVKEAKCLGVTIDDALTFKTHINNRMKCAYIRLRKLYRLRKFLPPKTKYFLCNTLVLSLFDYADVVYNDAITSQVAHSIQKVQNSCMRFAYNIPYRHHITPYLNSSCILNMKYRRKYHLYNFIYNVIRTGQPIYLSRNFAA